MSDAEHALLKRDSSDGTCRARCQCGWLADESDRGWRFAKERWYSEHAGPIRLQLRDERLAVRRAENAAADPATLAPKRSIPGGVVRQFGPNHWVAICHVCPKRLAQRTYDTEEAVVRWFLDEHLAPESVHWKFRYPDPSVAARRAEEQAIMDRVFGRGSSDAANADTP